MLTANLCDALLKLLVISTFCGSLVIETPVADLYAGYLVLGAATVLWAAHFFPLPRYLISACVLLFLHLLVTAVLRDSLEGLSDVWAGVRQIAGIAMVYGIASFLLTRSSLSTNAVYDFYVVTGIWFCIVGLFIYAVGFTWPGFSEFMASALPRWAGDKVTTFGAPRFVSLATEPSFALLSLTPLIFEAISRFVGTESRLGRGHSLMVVICAVLTMSPLVIVAIAFSLGFWLCARPSFRTVIPLLFALCLLALFYQVPDVHARILGLATAEDDEQGTNISVFTLINNASVAWTAFINSYGVGFGIGSHETSFGLYSAPVSDAVFQLNAKDANSLFLRLLSELGLLGLLGAALGLVLPLAMRNHTASDRSIAVSFVILLILFLIRTGHYFQLVFALFLVLLMATLTARRFNT